MTMKVVSQTPFVQAITQVSTVSVCVPFGVQITQPFASTVKSPIESSVASSPQFVNVVVPFTKISSAVAQIGGVGQVGQVGTMVVVSGTGTGGGMTI